MARNIKQIAQDMGAEIVGQVADAGGGGFGAARLPHVVHALQERPQRVRVGIIAPRPMFVRRENTHDSMPNGDQIQNAVMELQGPLVPSFGGTGHGPR